MESNHSTENALDSSTSYNDMVNTHVSAIDAAFPGVQPVKEYQLVFVT